MGARVTETKLREPTMHVVDGVECNIKTTTKLQKRSMGAVALPGVMVDGFAPIHMDVKDIFTVQCGLKQRLFRQLPTANKNAIADFKRFVSAWVRKNLKVPVVMSFEEWLAGTSYNEERKQQLRLAELELRGGLPNRRQCSNLKEHIKRESYPEYKHVRTINSRSDAFKAYSGPFFKSVEHELYKLPFFVKHMTPEERISRICALQKPNMNIYATDFTAYESHFVPEIMDACEMILYKYCAGYNHTLFRKIQSALTGRQFLRTRFGVSSMIKGRRMSGDMCTSLGNGFTNFMLASYIVSKKKGSLDMVVEGDDGLIVTDVELLQEDWAQLGFTIKMTHVDKVQEASFCGIVVSEDGTQIRDPRRFLSSFGWTESYMMAKDATLLSLLRAKSLSAICETPNCPIVGALARVGLALSEGYEPKYTDLYKQHPYSGPIPEFNPTEHTRRLFQQLYGISPGVQIIVEQLIREGRLDQISQHVHPAADTSDYVSRYVETLELPYRATTALKYAGDRKSVV